jgi:hypothetical protein
MLGTITELESRDDNSTTLKTGTITELENRDDNSGSRK